MTSLTDDEKNWTEPIRVRVRALSEALLFPPLELSFY